LATGVFEELPQALADLNEIKGKFCSEEKQKKELDAKKNELEKKAAFLAIEKSTLQVVKRSLKAQKRSRHFS